MVAVVDMESAEQQLRSVFGGISALVRATYRFSAIDVRVHPCGEMTVGEQSVSSLFAGRNEPSARASGIARNASR